MSVQGLSLKTDDSVSEEEIFIYDFFLSRHLVK
jgi:hypothetical protein